MSKSSEAPRESLPLGRLISYIVGGVATLALFSAMGFFMLRDDHPELAIALGKVVWGGLIVAAAAAVYAAVVGVYHTFLAVTGLDGGDAPPEGDEPEA